MRAPRVLCVLWECICVRWECICLLWECIGVLWERICVLWECICVLWECICVQRSVGDELIPNGVLAVRGAGARLCGSFWAPNGGLLPGQPSTAWFIPTRPVGRPCGGDLTAAKKESRQPASQLVAAEV